MKKILKPLVLVVITFISVSCSNENENVSNPSENLSSIQFKNLSTTDIETAKRLYADLIQTDDYISFKASLRAFNEKVNVTGLNFKSKAEWMNWISSNLNNTSFTSVVEFENEFDNSVGKLESIITANTTLFNIIGNANSLQLFEIMPPVHISPEYPPVPLDCLDDCIATYEAAEDQAYQDYYQDVENGSDGTLMGSIDIWFAMQKLDEMVYTTLPLQFNDCVGAC